MARVSNKHMSYLLFVCEDIISIKQPSKPNAKELKTREEN